jgi:hypothetical protein
MLAFSSKPAVMSPVDSSFELSRGGGYFGEQKAVVDVRVER